MTGTPDPTPRVSRRARTAEMHGYVSDLAAGRGRGIVVTGEPGIGKSELMRVARDEAVRLGCQVFWCDCEELSEAFPLLPLLDAFAPDGALSRYAEAHAQIAEWLRTAAIPGNRGDGVGAAITSMLSLISEVCEAGPALLVVDDLHWADPATVVTLSRLFRSTHRRPLLVAGVARPVPRRDDLAALRRAAEAQVPLSGLSDDEVLDIVTRAVGGRPGERLRRLAAEAGGNPLYLRELMDAVRRTGTVIADGGLVEMTCANTPDSLHSAIADRLGFLSAPVLEVLRVAALLGVAFPVSSLASVSGRGIGDLTPVLDEAIATGVLCEHGAELAFRHPLIRAALYEEMPESIRAAWHLDAARALVRQGASTERVARQVLPAIDSGTVTADRSLVEWLGGAVDTLAGQTPKATVKLLRWALADMPPTSTRYELLTCRLADALFRSGEPAEAARTAYGAVTFVRRPELVVDLHRTLMGCRAIEGRWDEALRAVEAALRMPGLDESHRARLLALSARTHRGLGRVDRAEEAARQALAVATSVGDRWATGWALGVMTVVHGMRGEEAAALPLFERALAVAEGDPSLADLRLMLLLNQAAALGDLDRYDEAIESAERAREQADASGSMVRLAQATCVLAELLFDVGRWDDVLERLDPDGGTPAEALVQCCNYGVVATIRLRRGDPAAIQSLLDAHRHLKRLGDDRTVGSLTLARSLEREQAGAPAEALAVLVDGLARCEEELEQTTDLLADAVRLAMIVGDIGRAEGLALRAEAVAGASEVFHRRAVGLHCRGLVDDDPAVLVEAADQYGKASRPLPRAQALEAAGVGFAESGDVPAARRAFTGAYEVYSALGASWDLARIQARFRTYGIRRGPRFQHRRSQQGWDSLTPAEKKVVGLVAEGLSNPQIAAQLFLSRRTVQTHVSHVLSKLELSSRSEIVREAGRTGS
ncbi:LuxR family transcriptional regulator [Virgisporangium ochraceum]|uniref:LuxR family transcriptional regulator n=1 Tax=Virgisporangium ochraceum TaxID=65505 RepID=A0A8J4EC85_9ACTN|nr:AAA family ATPase [Virgisporangium ochraceum]GIJ70225.1 LuxR family transcriptional regulator [Virgisporangium ochraceum]